jgi:hypothetical protein
MAEKEIELIKNQIEKLNDPSFDLKVWKNTTTMVLSLIFGKDSDKIEQIKNINYDYSSWTLRDTSGASATEIVKKLGRELLETAIQELEVFGLPEKQESGQLGLGVIQTALEDNLRISQYRELISIIREIQQRPDRKKKLNEKLQTYGDETVREVLSSILSHPELESLK